MDQPITYREVKDEEKRRRVAAELSADPTRSTRIIAKAAGVSQSTAFRIRRELECGGDTRLLETKKEAPAVANGPRLTDQERQSVRDELTRDPKRSNRFIAALLNLSPDTVRHERDKMERDGKIPPVPREERVNSTGRAGNKSGAGSKIGGGIPLMQLASKGLLLEEENPGMSVDDVALLLGIHGATYRGLRSVRLLSLRDDLSKADGKMVQETIERIEKTRQISPYWPDIKPIATKIWGKSGQNTTVGTKAETKRKSAFDHAIGLITDMCFRGPEVEIPYLSEEEQIAALHKVTEAINCLKQLNSNIRRARG